MGGVGYEKYKIALSYITEWQVFYFLFLVHLFRFCFYLRLKEKKRKENKMCISYFSLSLFLVFYHSPPTTGGMFRNYFLINNFSI